MTTPLQASFKNGFIEPDRRYRTAKGEDVHYYESLAQLMPALNQANIDTAFLKDNQVGWRQEKANANNPKYELKWSGGMVLSDAVKKAEIGVTLDVEALEIRDRIMTEVKPMVDDCFNWDVTGSMVDVGAFLSGEPECMMDTREDMTRSRKTVTIVYNGAVSCAVDEKIMRLRGLAMMAFIDALESTKRYRVNLYYVSASGNSYSSDNCRGALVVRLLDPSHPYDPQAMGFALSQPAMFRKMVFAYWNLLSPKDANHWGVSNWGYGTPGTLRKLPKEIDDVEVYGANECLHTGVQQMSVHDMKSAVAWVRDQMARLTTDAVL